MVLDINNQVITFNFSLMNETLKQTSAVDRGFKLLSVQTKDYKIECFFASLLSTQQKEQRLANSES
jgi:hypothetical protein